MKKTLLMSKHAQGHCTTEQKKTRWLSGMLVPRFRGHAHVSIRDIRTQLTAKEVLVLFADKRVVHYLEYRVAFSDVDKACIGVYVDEQKPTTDTIVTLFDEPKLPALLPQILVRKRWKIDNVIDGPEPGAERICMPNSPHFYERGLLEVVTGPPPSITHYEQRWEHGFTDGLFQYRTVLTPIVEAIHVAALKTERLPHEVGLYCRVNNKTRLEIPTWILLELAK